jgi:hypothetical protein
VEDKKLLIRRYENAARTIKESPGDDALLVSELLDRLLNDHRNDLQMLEQAAAEINPRP